MEDLFEIAALLPWWAGVLLAAVAYFGFHMIAVSPPRPTTPGHIGSFAGHTLWKGLATALCNPPMNLYRLGVEFSVKAREENSNEAVEVQ